MYEILKEKFGEKKAKTVIDYLDSSVSEKVESKSRDFATKEDISKLEILISKEHADIIKWIFIFWVGTLGIMITIVKLL